MNATSSNPIYLYMYSRLFDRVDHGMDASHVLEAYVGSCFITWFKSVLCLIFTLEMKLSC
jgi:hypothetical protein